MWRRAAWPIWYITPPSFPGMRNASQEMPCASTAASRCSARRHRSSPARRRGRGRSRTRSSAGSFRPARTASIPSASRISIRRRSSRRSSSGCSPTTISRARRRSCRWSPKPCPRSRTTARPTRSRSGRASTSRRTPRSRARSASSRAEDFVYTYMRFIDPKNRSPYAFLLEGKIVGLDELAAKAKQTGKFDYDAKVARHGGRRPVHAALSPQGDRLQLPVRGRAHVARRGRARGDRGVRRRHDGASGRHRRLHAEELDAALEDRARGESRVSGLRLGLPAVGRRRGTRRSSRR